MATDVDDQLIKANPDRMAYGWDNSGNIFNWDQKYSEKLCAEGGGKFHLVTADGGIDCTVGGEIILGRTIPNSICFRMSHRNRRAEPVP
jgi:hypothetical protein